MTPLHASRTLFTAASTVDAFFVFFAFSALSSANVCLHTP